jgi:probable F420-dependent oxidoreductase
VRFSTGFPGLMRYPPDRFPPGADRWESRLTAADFQRIARTADDLGYDAISVPEHMVMPKDLVPHMGPYWPDAFTVMTFIAGATTRIRVNSSVIVLPYHHPVAFAKAVSTLDVLSGGRVTITVGAGMAPGEFAALGVPFRQRGRRTDEYLAVLKLLWTAEAPEFHGEFVDIVDVVFEPKPVQKPHPPLWIGGSSMAALRRAARVGDGWAPAGSQGGKGPWLQSLEDLPGFLDEARRCPGFTDREPSFDISMGLVQSRIGPDHQSLPNAEPPPRTAQEIIDRIGALQDAGVTWTSVQKPGGPAESLDEYLDGLQWAVTEVIEAGGFR